MEPLFKSSLSAVALASGAWMLGKTVLAAFASLAIAGLTPLHAQAQPSPGGLKRLNELGGFVSEAVFCKTMGYETTQDFDRYNTAVKSEGGRYGISGEVSSNYALAAMNAHTQTLKAELESATEGLSAEEDADVQAAVPKFTAFASEHAQRCHRIAADPVGSILVPEPAHEAETYSRQYADSLLILVGHASWQTPFIRTGGEVAEAVGLCEAHLTRTQADGYLVELYKPNRFSLAVEDKAREFFDSRRQRGRDLATDTALDATQCNRILTGRAARLKAAN